MKNLIITLTAIIALTVSVNAQTGIKSPFKAKVTATNSSDTTTNYGWVEVIGKKVFIFELVKSTDKADKLVIKVKGNNCCDKKIYEYKLNKNCSYANLTKVNGRWTFHSKDQKTEENVVKLDITDQLTAAL